MYISPNKTLQPNLTTILCLLTASIIFVPITATSVILRLLHVQQVLAEAHHGHGLGAVDVRVAALVQQVQHALFVT